MVLCCGGAILLLVGVVCLYMGIQRHSLYQKIKNTPTSKVRSAAVGFVELFGKAKCEKDTLSPLSKAKCVFWQVTGEYYYQTRKSSGWRQFYKAESGIPFYLEDNTGKMLVDPAGGQVEISHDFQVKGHMKGLNLFGLELRKKMSDKILDWIKSDPKIKSKFEHHSGRKLRITEYYIAEGDPLYVIGKATPTKEGSAVAHENLMVKKGPLNILYISDSGEKKVLGTIKWSWMLLLGIGVVVTALGLAFLLFEVGLMSLLGRWLV